MPVLLPDAHLHANVLGAYYCLQGLTMSGIMWRAKARPTTAVKSDVMRSRLGHSAAAAEQCATS